MPVIRIESEKIENQERHAGRVFVHCLSYSALMLSVWSHAVLAADYTQDIKPLLAKKCGSCHGPLKQEAGLRLDSARFIHAGSENGPVAVVGQAQASKILERVTATEDRMPPEGEGEPLTAGQVEWLRDWINRGLPAPEHEDVLQSPSEHWAFQPIRRPPLPEPTSESVSQNPIDLFLDQLRRQKGPDVVVAPVPEAEPEIVLRRLHLDLTGLPPVRDDLLRFRQALAESASREFVYGAVVDDLLDSPRHGERWARHWMDVWRYSDWDGYKDELRGSQRHLWRWRDWIVDSLNDDKGYDQMIVEMLAADEAAPEDEDALRATGFLARHHYKFNRDMWLDNCVEHTSKAFLGLTINCSKCHDHKYDPFPQHDYYSFRAFFEPYKVRIDRIPGEMDSVKDGLTRAFDEDLAAVTYVYERGNEKAPLKDHPVDPGIPELFGTSLNIEPVSLPLKSWFPAIQEFFGVEALQQVQKKLAAATKELEANGDEHQKTLLSLKLEAAQTELASTEARLAADRTVGMLSEDDPERVKLATEAARLERAGKVVQARVELLVKEQALAKLQSEKAAQDKIDKGTKDVESARQALDEAVKNSPLTDNKYTPLGPTYPRSSTGRRLALARWLANPENPLTARVAVNHLWLRHFGAPLVENVFDFGLRSPQPIHHELLDWLAVEFMEHGWSMKHLHRLMVSSAAYRQASYFDATQPACIRNLELDPDNRLYWHAHPKRMEAEAVRDAVLHVSGMLDTTQGGPDIDYNQGDGIPRRSLYFRHAYEKQMTMLLLFDAANPNECYQRTESIVPQQALALFNSELSIRASTPAVNILVAKLEAAGQTSPENFCIAAFEHLLSRDPSATELATCLSFLQAAPAGTEVSRRSELVHVLLNHNDFITVR